MPSLARLGRFRLLLRSDLEPPLVEVPTSKRSTRGSDASWMHPICRRNRLARGEGEEGALFEIVSFYSLDASPGQFG